MHLIGFHDTYEPAGVVANLIYHTEACLFNSLKILFPSTQIASSNSDSRIRKTEVGKARSVRGMLHHPLY
jgi:hypothetical protein